MGSGHSTPRAENIGDGGGGDDDAVVEATCCGC